MMATTNVPRLMCETRVFVATVGFAGFWGSGFGIYRGSDQVTN